MSTGITMIEFEKREVHLSSELEGGPPFTVHGVALGEGDVTRGSSGIEKYWPGEELKEAAETLEGRNLVEDHENASRGVVGEVTKAGFKEGVGILYEAELYDEDLAEKINNGLLEVSIRGFHKDVDEMEEHEETGAKVVEDIEFDNLSIVPSGASPSNTLEMGPAAELSVAALSEYVEELQDIEAGDFVQWGDDMHGVVLTMPEDGEVEVDVYEKTDDTWRAIGETTEVSVDSLSEWGVDEDNIGSADEEDSNEESEDEEENQEGGVPEEHRFESEEAAEDAADELDTEGAHQMEFEDEVAWVPGTTHDMYLENVEEASRKRGEGEEIRLESDEERKEHSGEHRNPDREFDDEYEDDGSSTEEASADEGSKESDVEELQEWEFHNVSWDGTTESDWSRPSKDDFDTDDLSEIDSHFLISQTGFPPENFSDLALPVVGPSGNLNLNALDAVKGGHGASQVDGLSDDKVDDIIDYVNNLANEHFDKDWGEEENEDTSNPEPDATEVALEVVDSYNGDDATMDEMLGWVFTSTDISTQQVEALRAEANAFLDREGADSFGTVALESFRSWLNGEELEEEQDADGSKETHKLSSVTVLSSDDLRKAEGASKKDNLNRIEVLQNMTDIEEELEELDEPVAVEKDDLEELQEKADRMDEMSDTLSDLKERTDVLDSVDSEKVEELAEGEDPIVLEKDEYEELTAEAEQVKAVYAETLSEEGPFAADELVDKFSIEELREKYDEAGHELDEELEADPKSGNMEEEELEEREEEENKSEEELEQEEAIEEKQAELREKILGGN